jgi:uncharacterized tellurite resistance protein B-like protein
MLNTLSPEDRLRLVKFVCSFAWADLEVNDAERGFLQDLVRRLSLDGDEAAEVEAMLRSPPAPEDVDPLDVPAEHRQLFLDTVLQMMAADGELSEAEAENYNLLSQLLG